MTDDYEDAEEYLDENDSAIELDWQRPYTQLTRDEQKTAILDLFFKGQKRYEEAASRLRDGIARPSATPVNIKRRGRNYSVIRDEKGHFRKWYLS